MKIEFDFRTDITVCELVQYLCDELEVQSRFTDNDIARYAEGVRGDTMSWLIEEDIMREKKLVDLIENIQTYAMLADRYEV
jgi:hypothetical protein